MTKTKSKITLDFNGTNAQAVGPINWAADYAEGRFLIKWIAPIMRNLADTPERAAEISCNEGVVEVFEIVFPPKGTLITPVRPAPTNARAFVLLRMLSLFAGVLAQAVDGFVNRVMKPYFEDQGWQPDRLYPKVFELMAQVW